MKSETSQRNVKKKKDKVAYRGTLRYSRRGTQRNSIKVSQWPPGSPFLGYAVGAITNA